MSKPCLPEPCKPLCECRFCECPTCPHVMEREIGSYECNHGTRPKCACETAKKNTCRPCCLNEPEPIVDPERTQSLMKVLKYDKGCFCKVVTRAVRADIHRYLGMIDMDRH